MVAGYTSSAGLTAANATADRLVLSEFTVDEDCLISKLSAYIDGGGPVNGDQELRAVIYSSDDDLVAQSPIVVINDLQGVQWVDFIFDAPVSVTAGNYALGLHTGGPSTAARYYTSGSGTNLSTTTDAFSGGAGSTVSPSYSSGELAIYATFAYAWTPPFEDDLYLANLGYPSAQQALGTAEADPRTKQRVYASWHGTFVDPQPQGASLALVQQGGKLSSLLGERVRVSNDNRSTVVFIHRELDLDLDDDTQISLSRRAWQALGRLSEDSLLVTVEVIPGLEE